MAILVKLRIPMAIGPATLSSVNKNIATATATKAMPTMNRDLLNLERFMYELPGGLREGCPPP